MFASSRIRLPVPAEIRLAADVPPALDGSVDVRFRRQRAPGAGARVWKAVITVHPETSPDPDEVLAHADDFCVEDADGAVGIVSDVRFGEEPGSGTLRIATGWFGRKQVTIPIDDVVEILPGERKLIVRARGADAPSR